MVFVFPESAKELPGDLQNGPPGSLQKFLIRLLRTFREDPPRIFSEWSNSSKANEKVLFEFCWLERVNIVQKFLNISYF